MNILITGGAGYFGVMLSRTLLEKGYKVTVLDNFLYGYESMLHLLEYGNLKVIKDDIRNDLSRYLKRYDVVYHLAAISGYPACEANPSSAKLINVDATRRLIKSLSKEQIVIYASTTSFYGKSGNICDEISKVDSVSLYGVTKYQGEEIVMEKENSIALRFATIFGISPKMRIDLLVNDFVYKAVNDRCIVLFEGQTKRTFLHIKDAIRAYVMALEKIDLMKNEIYNVGDNTFNFSKAEIAEKIKDYTGCEIIDSDMPDLDLRSFVISFEKIHRLGYKTLYTLDDGIEELIRLYKFYKPFSTYKTI